MKAGFTLLEILIAAAVAGILSAALFLGLNQVIRAVHNADDVVSMFDRMILVRRQFERDMSGIFLPTSRPFAKEDEAQQEAQPAQEGAQPQKQEEQTKKKLPPIPRVFFAKNKGPHLDLITFFTNNPLDVYWSDKTGSARPRIARVQYYLEQEPRTEKNPSYVLYRQEGYTLEYDQFKKDAAKPVRAYMLISGIKELKLTYGQVTYTKEIKKDGQKTTTETKKETREVTDWDLKLEELQKENKQVSPIPEWIKIELTLWNDAKKRSRSFTFYVGVPFRVEKEEKKKQQQTPQQPAAGQQQKVAAPAQKAEPSKDALALQLETITDVHLTVSGDESIINKLAKKDRNISEKRA